MVNTWDTPMPRHLVDQLVNNFIRGLELFQKSELKPLPEYFEDTISLLEKAPHPYPSRLALIFAYYVFQSHGRPLAHLPKREFADMIRRLSRMRKRRKLIPGLLGF